MVWSSYFKFLNESSFNFEKSSSEELFQLLLVNPELCEEKQPLKSVRRNKVYTIRNSSFDDISCDNNGAYINSNNVKRDFFVKITNSKVTVKKVHVVNGELLYKERKSRIYIDNFVDKNNVFLIERYYRQNKSIPQLKRMIFRIKNLYILITNLTLVLCTP